MHKTNGSARKGKVFGIVDDALEGDYSSVSTSDPFPELESGNKNVNDFVRDRKLSALLQSLEDRLESIQGGPDPGVNQVEKPAFSITNILSLFKHESFSESSLYHISRVPLLSIFCLNLLFLTPLSYGFVLLYAVLLLVFASLCAAGIATKEGLSLNAVFHVIIGNYAVLLICGDLQHHWMETVAAADFLTSLLTIAAFSAFRTDIIPNLARDLPNSTFSSIVRVAFPRISPMVLHILFILSHSTVILLSQWALMRFLVMFADATIGSVGGFILLPIFAATNRFLLLQSDAASSTATRTTLSFMLSGSLVASLFPFFISLSLYLIALTWLELWQMAKLKEYANISQSHFATAVQALQEQVSGVSELRRINEGISERSAFMRRFFLDSRNVISGILGMSSLLLNDPTQIDRESREFVLSIRESADSLMSLMNLLSVMMDEREVSSREKSFDVDFELEKCCATVMEQSTTMTNIINISEQQIGWLCGDIDRFRHVLLLVVKALANVSSKGTLTCSMSLLPLESVNASPRDSSSVDQEALSGEENEGIAKRELLMLFHPEQRSLSAEKDVSVDQVRLALLVASQIVRTMHGVLIIERSRTGEVTSVKLSCPFTLCSYSEVIGDSGSNKTSVPQYLIDDDSAKLQGKRILAVVDVESMFHLVSRRLSPYGASCSLASSADTAFAILDKGSTVFDILLIDLELGWNPIRNATSFEVTKFLATIPINENILGTRILLFHGRHRRVPQHIVDDPCLGTVGRPLITPEFLAAVVKALDTERGYFARKKLYGIRSRDDSLSSTESVPSILEAAKSPGAAVVQLGRASLEGRTTAMLPVSGGGARGGNPFMESIDGINPVFRNDKRKKFTPSLSMSSLGEEDESTAPASLPAIHEEADSPVEKEKKKKLCVLLAEDSKVNARVNKTVLTKQKFDVEVAENGKVALEMYKERHYYDIILMDIHMPVMNGLESSRLIREFEEESECPAVPIIALTADLSQGHREACMAAGCNSFISKPVNFAELIDLIHTLVGRQ